MKFLFLTMVVLLCTFSAKATDFGIGDSGIKKFILNSKVNEPVLKFYSSTPVEDIEGNVIPDKNVVSQVESDPSNIEELRGSVSFSVKSMKTGIKMRDEHLYSADWLNADKNPKISFDVKSIKNVKPGPKTELKGKSEVTAIVQGIFFMNGKSKEIEVPIAMSYIQANEQTAKRAQGDFLMVSGEFDIALKDFDVKGAKGIIGKKVGEQIKITLKLFYSSEK